MVALTAVAVVWATYLAVDPRLRFSPAEPVPVIRGLHERLVELMPFPGAFRAGMRAQFGLENLPWQGYLFGRPRPKAELSFETCVPAGEAA